LDAIINDEPPTTQVTDSAVPPPYRWLVERCLTKNASERYASTIDLYRDLVTLRDRFGEVVARSASPTVSRPSRWRRLLPGTALPTIILAGALFVLGGDDTPPSLGDGLILAPFTSDPGYEGMPAWSPDGQTIAYVADVDSTLQVFTRQRSS